MAYAAGMLRRLLLSVHADRWILLFGMLLALPALGMGFLNDDYLHQAHMDGRWAGGAQHPIWSLFDFVGTDPTIRGQQDARGILPWWAPPDLHLSFMRPLSSATHWLDHLLWPSTAWLQHAHSLLWWALCLVGARLVLRRVHGAGGVAALALLLFAVDDAHILPIGWLANRNALVALAMGLGAFYAWIRWRAQRTAGWAALSLGGLALALLAGESGIGTFAWMVAWQLAVEEGRLGARLAPLLRPAAVVVIWRITYQFLGYGAHGSGIYIDPGHDPLTFLSGLAERLPLLGLSLLSGAPVEVQVIALPPMRLILALIAAIICAVAIRWAWPMLRSDRLARFHALGACLALVPAAATFPMSRLLGFAGLNAVALLAMMTRRAGWLDPVPSPAPTRGLGAMLLLNGPLPALALVGTLVGAPTQVQKLQGTLFGHRVGKPGPELLVQVNGEPMMTPYMMLGLVAPEEAPERLAVLSAWTQPVTVAREDEHTLVLTVDRGFLLAAKEQLFRGLTEPFHVGDSVVRPDYTALVRAVLPNGQPQTVAFRFARPLGELEIEAWTGEAFTPLALNVGETRRLPDAFGGI